MAKKICDSCSQEFEDFGHVNISTCMRCNKPSTVEADKAYEEKQDKLKSFPLTTSFQFANQEIEIELGIVSAECVFGMNVFRDVFTSVRDVVGGRSKASEKVLKDLKDTCLAELKQDAFKLGADGVLSVSFDYQEFSGGGKSMLFLVASGTAVKFKEQSS
jgi:uncharacterized protein YbjQ (UPF0145 family)|tara:strand:+ start:875 stop:1354 length:480 start_codon:yes stop_codon:yes gene_type:complete